VISRCVPISIALALASAAANAASDEFRLTCGGAEVRVLGDFDSDLGSHSFTKFEMQVTRGDRQLAIAFGYGFMHLACLENSERQEMIVVQQYCDGSACKDLDNYGIVDPRSVTLLLRPDDSNRAEAARILGKAEAPRLFGHPQATWLEHN
jgi:hypothetical protein